ncbi:hypothetical protein HGRIS_007708 [Hohenbuehelia grisea]|uniref:Defect at low temperature protein 1 n=1 Tax=Hohenbuehelia grisea TaxID=104357 RepID=A0ABR3J631_9AGAR
MGSLRINRTVVELSYFFLLLLTICVVGLSCVALLSQAVRTSPHQSWKDNVNAVVIAAAYFIVLIASFLLCAKRRLAVNQRLQRIAKAHKTIGRNDLPKSVHEYVEQEYVRACLITYESQPKDAFHEGWGRPGTQYEGVRFRRALLDTVHEIDELAHIVFPRHRPLKPHARMLEHFRALIPLLPSTPEGISYLHYYDSAVQIARDSSKEPTEEEFDNGMRAVRAIVKA